jgi:hypothetical protein
MMGRKRVIPGQSKRVIPGHAIERKRFITVHDRKEESYTWT